MRGSPLSGFKRLRPAYGSGEDWNMGTSNCPVAASNVAAPGLRVGRGLEPDAVHPACGLRCCSARLSGRARIGTRLTSTRSKSTSPCARASVRARIGTANGMGSRDLWSRCARPSGRARVGTTRTPSPSRWRSAAPGFRVGRGLEHVSVVGDGFYRRVAPGLRAGRGLERVPGDRRPLGLLCGA